MKHVPMRSCIVCRAQKDKSALVRLVRKSDGTVSVDMTGKEPGRGAYVCAEGSCKADLVKKRVLNKVFKQQVPQEVYESLRLQFAEKCDE